MRVSPSTRIRCTPFAFRHTTSEPIAPYARPPAASGSAHRVFCIYHSRQCSDLRIQSRNSLYAFECLLPFALSGVQLPRLTGDICVALDRRAAILNASKRGRNPGHPLNGNCPSAKFTFCKIWLQPKCQFFPPRSGLSFSKCRSAVITVVSAQTDASARVSECKFGSSSIA